MKIIVFCSFMILGHVCIAQISTTLDFNFGLGSAWCNNSNAPLQMNQAFDETEVFEAMFREPLFLDVSHQPIRYKLDGAFSFGGGILTSYSNWYVGAELSINYYRLASEQKVSGNYSWDNSNNELLPSTAELKFTSEVTRLIQQFRIGYGNKYIVAFFKPGFTFSLDKNNDASFRYFEDKHQTNGVLKASHLNASDISLVLGAEVRFRIVPRVYFLVGYLGFWNSTFNEYRYKTFIFSSYKSNTGFTSLYINQWQFKLQFDIYKN